MASSREAALAQQVADLEQELAKERKDLAKAKHLRAYYQRNVDEIVESTIVLPKPLPAPLLARFKELYEQAVPDKPAGLTLKPAQAGALTGALMHFLRVDGRDAEAVGPLESVEEVSCACLFVLGEFCLECVAPVFQLPLLFPIFPSNLPSPRLPFSLVILFLFTSV